MSALPAGSEPRMPESHRRFLDSLAAELATRDPSGALLRRVDDPAALARVAAERAVASANVWHEHLGEFYDVDGVREILTRNGRPISKQAVSKRCLLALRTGSGRVVYPAFQFRDGAPLPGLDGVLAALPDNVVSRWTVASWLVSAQSELGGERPVDLLAAGVTEPVTCRARAWAERLAV